MATLSHSELEALWVLHGGDQADADTAAAIAQAESHGCQYAKAGPTDDRPVKQCTYRKTNLENSYGLWQINRRAHPQYSARSLYTVGGNADAAVAIRRARGDFTDWTTYTNGAYTQYLTSGGTPTPTPGPTAPPTADTATPHMHSGWADLRQSVNVHMVNQLRKSDTATRAAYRVLAGKHRKGR